MIVAVLDGALTWPSGRINQLRAQTGQIAYTLARPDKIEREQASAPTLAEFACGRVAQ